MIGERVKIRSTGEIGVVVDVELDDGEYWYSVDSVYSTWTKVIIGTDLMSLYHGPSLSLV